jgi:chemotaxis protein methyltransferase CheR
MRADEFRLLRDFVYEHAGLHFDDTSAYLFDRRLGERHNLTSAHSTETGLE